MQRRQFLASSLAPALQAQSPARPNILWLTCEDTGPQIGCYGDKFARTPRLDAFAEQSLRYLHCWSNAPVCAPARTTIISGLYPPSTGAEHMRSMTRLPEDMKMFPAYLRESGYYCTNNQKEDYNLEHTGTVWDESSARAHYKSRKAGQPFFAVFNNTITHESQIRRRPHTLQSDPREVRVRAYHPDTPEVRRDWAQYYDNIRTMDTWFGKQMEDLAAAGLADSTIVFFYGDHGSGMPRSKRWPYNSGLHVPLLVHVPEKFRSLAPGDYRPGATTRRLVSFVDLAPTVLSLAGIPAKPWHQGFAFAGAHAAPEQPYVYGFRGRMDERYDMTRSVRDTRYSYLRQYMPHKIYGQHVSYMFETPTTAMWSKMHGEGKLNAAQSHFWKTKPAEELYDLEKDPDEVNNLAGSPEHKAVLEKMRKAQQALAARIRDVGFLPEEEIHSRAAGSTPYTVGHDNAKYPFARVFRTAEAASSLSEAAIPALEKALKDPDSAVRYWGALGLLMRKKAAPLRGSLEDASGSVRAVAAEALGLHGTAEDAGKAEQTLLALANPDTNGVFVSMLALNALDSMGARAGNARAAVAKLPKEVTKAPHGRFNSYVPRLIEHIQKP